MSTVKPLVSNAILVALLTALLSFGPARAAGPLDEIYTTLGKPPSPPLSAAAQALPSAPAISQAGPSFSCTNVSQPFAVIVCSDAELSRLDAAVADSYTEIRDAATGPLRLEVIDNQLNWTRDILTACAVPEKGVVGTARRGTAITCLRNLYQKRLAALDGDQWHDPRARFEASLAEDTRQQIQQKLAEQGFYKDEVDGRFGPRTRHALTAAQRQFGLTPTGFVSNELVAKLFPVGQDKSLPTAASQAATVAGTASPAGFNGSGSTAVARNKGIIEDTATIELQTEHNGSISIVAFSPDGRFALSGGRDSTPRLWEVTSGRLLRRFLGHPAGTQVNSVAFSPDGRFVLSGGDDGSVLLWETASGRELHYLRLRGDVQSVAFSPDGRLAHLGGAGMVIFWEVASWREARRPLLLSDSDAISLSQDGLFALSIDKQNIHLWEMSSEREVGHFKEASNIATISFSADGTLAITGNSDHTLGVWELATGRKLRSLIGHDGVVLSAIFSLDKRIALSGSADHTLRLWDVVSGGELRRFSGHTEPVLSVSLSPDGRHAISGSMDATVRLWDVESGRELKRIGWNINHIATAEFLTDCATDGRKALVGGENGTAGLWDLATGREVRRLYDKGVFVVSTTNSSNGWHALSLTQDRDLSLWSVESGRELFRFDNVEVYHDGFFINPSAHLMGGWLLF